ncbi:hypothetical protein [Streptomyces sp. NPDC018000]|uniref:hypothetical protein n=1 Tax=Streptomyces sp. NPDC018000 TaxID=3365028 RepID=UPI003796B8CA
MVFLLLVAGFDIIVNFLSTGVYRLLLRPNQFAALRVGPCSTVRSRWASPSRTRFAFGLDPDPHRRLGLTRGNAPAPWTASTATLRDPAHLTGWQNQAAAVG